MDICSWDLESVCNATAAMAGMEKATQRFSEACTKFSEEMEAICRTVFELFDILAKELIEACRSVEPISFEFPDWEPHKGNAMREFAAALHPAPPVFPIRPKSPSGLVWQSGFLT